MDEEISLKVNQMTKLVMASTADARLIQLPGMARRHEVYTIEQLRQDESNERDLITSITDSQEHQHDE
jgi:hypothetical protein